MIVVVKALNPLAIDVGTLLLLQEDEETVPRMEPPPIPDLSPTADSPPFEPEPLITLSDDPPEDFTPPDLPPTQPEITTGSGVEDVMRERRTIKPFITTHTESFPSSSS